MPLFDVSPKSARFYNGRSEDHSGFDHWRGCAAQIRSDSPELRFSSPLTSRRSGIQSTGTHEFMANRISISVSGELICIRYRAGAGLYRDEVLEVCTCCNRTGLMIEVHIA
jgi:hypothetical protein